MISNRESRAVVLSVVDPKRLEFSGTSWSQFSPFSPSGCVEIPPDSELDCACVSDFTPSLKNLQGTESAAAT